MNPASSISNKTFIISIAVLLLTIAAAASIASRGKLAVIEINLDKIPIEIAGFSGTEDFFSQAVYDELNADKHVYRHYRSKDGRQVDLYIGYYGTAKGGRTPHNPYACLPGAGWGIIKTAKIKLKAGYCKDGVNVSYILSKNGPTYESVLHWYQSDAVKVLDSGLKQNIQRFIGRTLYNKNDGAFVRVSVHTNREGIDEANTLGKSFATEVLALLPKYWPVEQ